MPLTLSTDNCTSHVTLFSSNVTNINMTSVPSIAVTSFASVTTAQFDEYNVTTQLDVSDEK